MILMLYVYYTEADWQYGHLGNTRWDSRIVNALMNNGPTRYVTDVRGPFGTQSASCMIT